MSVQFRVICKRCGKDWWAYTGQDEVQCNCHEYCIDGDKPQDCTLIDSRSGTVDAWDGQYGWPQGMHLSQSHNGADVKARIKYCTVHGNYVNKVPLTIPVERNRRVQNELKWHRGTLNV